MNNHLFYEHLLKKKHSLPLFKNQSDLIWPSVLLLFCLGLLVFLKVTSNTKVLKIIQSTFSTNALHELEREETKSFKLHSMLLSIFFLLNISFLLYKVNYFYKLVFVSHDFLIQFLIIFLFVLVFATLKSFINQLICILTNNFKTISDYTYNSIKINQTFGIFLFPWLILLELSTFNPLIFLSGAFVVITISLFYRWYRGVIVGLVEERIGILQTFTYFCGLEILPVFVSVKYIVETF